MNLKKGGVINSKRHSYYSLHIDVCVICQCFRSGHGGGASLEITVFLRILMTHPVFFAAYRNFFKG